MGYYNPIYIYGVDRFLADAKAAGVDGLIVVDLPPEEDDELCLPGDEGRASISSASPRRPPTKARARRCSENRRVRLLCLGARHHRHQDARSRKRREQCHPSQGHTQLPIAVGFGVKTAEQARDIAKNADGVVVGSALVNAVRDSLTKAGKPTPKPCTPCMRW